MADGTSISIGFNTKEAQQEIKNLTNAMKQTQNEFKITDTTLKSTGSSVDILKNKYQSLSTQMKQQSEITAKCTQGVESYSQKQEAARQRLEKANEAYAKGKTEMRGNKEELQKLKDEVSKAEKAVKSADTGYERWNNKLSQSRLAEANLRNELNQTSEALKKQSSYIAQVQEKYKQLNARTSGLQKGLTTTGKVLTTGVTLPIATAAAYAVKSFNEVDDGADIVIEKTGATGEAAKELEAIYKQVAKEIPGEFNDIGSAVGEINTRLGFTGDKLKTASKDFLKFARVNKADVNTAVQLVTRAMGDASIPADEYKTVLDAVTVASQKSGISIESLTTNLAKYGAPMRALGLGLKDSIALFAAWEKSGVNTEIAFSGMKKAISNWGKAGKDSRIEFAKTLQDIKSAPDIAAATTKAIEVFGAKAGPDLADAIKGGRFEVSEYMEALANAGGTVDNTYNEIIDGTDEAKLAIQNIKVSFSELGEKIVTTAGPALQSLAKDIGWLIDRFGELDEGTQNNILRFGLLAAAAGPVLSLASKGVKVVNGGISLFSKLATVFGGTTTAATVAAKATAAAGETTTAATTTAAAGTAAWTSGLGSLASAAGTAAIPLGILTAALAAPAAVAGVSMSAIEQYHKNLIASGNEAVRQAKDYEEKVKTSYNMEQEAKTVEDYYNRYSQLIQLKDTDLDTEKTMAERKEIEQWFIDNYGQYINAEEQKNGVHQDTLEFIRDITAAERERADAEKQASLQKTKNEASSRRDNAEKSKEEIPKLQGNIDNFTKKIQQSEILKSKLETLKVQYEALDKYDSEALQKFMNKNKAIADEYKQLAGVDLKYPELSKQIENLSGMQEDWNNQIKYNQDLVDGHKRSIQEYKESLNVLQGAVADEALSKSGFSSIGDLFASEDVTAINNAINNVISKCYELGMTTEETGLSVALFKNGFSNLKDAMASGDKDMKKVIDDFNTYMHTVGDMPDTVSVTVNANGDIEIIDTVQEKMDNIDGTKAEAKVSISDDGGEQTVLTLQELIDKFGAAKAVALLKADDKATVTIDGVSYRLSEYNTETGVAILKADDSDAELVIRTATGEVQGFNMAEGTATLKVDDSRVNSVLQAAVAKVRNWTNSVFANLGFTHHAKGTSNSAGGPAIINDETGVSDPRELVEHNGEYYLFEGKNVLVNLSKGDSVYTAAQTKKMLANLPHYATGTNNESFNNAKSDFEYKKKTSVVTDSESLLWWKNILQEYASDADVVKEANIEIYELTKKINDNAIKDYKNRIKKQESNSKDWIEYEIKMHNLSIDEQIAAYGRMDDNYYKTLVEMQENTTMTAEELEEVWSEYYDTIRDHEMKVADLKKKNLENQNKESLKYIEERTYYNDWEKFDDSPEAAYDRIKERNSQSLLNGEITQDEYNQNMTDAGQKLYEGRLENSKKWLEMQKKYGAITDEEYRAGLKRIKEYTEQFYKEGIISGKYYYEAMDDANSDLFDNMSASLESYINQYYESQKEMLTARKNEIEAEYNAMEAAEKKADRLAELKDLQAQYEKYQNAVTIEGKKKLKEIQDNIDSLKKEEATEIREAEKQSRLDEVDKENEELEKEQESALKGISQYTAQALGIISGGNDEMVSKFNKVVENYNNQQAQLAQSGYDTVSKIVDMTNSKLAELGQNLQPQSAGNGDVKVTVTQTFNNNINDEVSAMAYGKHASSLARDLEWVSKIKFN